MSDAAFVSMSSAGEITRLRGQVADLLRLTWDSHPAPSIEKADEHDRIRKEHGL